MYNSAGTVLRGDINAVVEEALANDQFYIGAKIMPPITVSAKSGQYPKLTKTESQLLDIGTTIRKPTSSYGEITRAWTSDTYDTVDRGLEEPVDDTNQSDLSRYFNLEAASARHVLRSVMLDHEYRVASAIFSTTNFTDYANSATAYTETNIATIDFPRDVQAAIRRLLNNGEQANTIVMNDLIYDMLSRSTYMQNFCRGALPSDAKLNLTPAAMASAFAPNGITQVLVGRSRYNSAKRGQSYTAGSIWSNTYVWVGNVTTSQDLTAGGCGFTLVWNAEGGLFVTETYRDEKRRSNIIRVRQNTAEKIVNAGAGTLIVTQYSA